MLCLVGLLAERSILKYMRFLLNPRSFKWDVFFQLSHTAALAIMIDSLHYSFCPRLSSNTVLSLVVHLLTGVMPVSAVILYH